MRMYDLIEKKRNGGILQEPEIRWMIREYVAGSIPEYQMSAMLMAIYFQGMTDPETFVLTDAVARSGDMVDLSPIDGIKVDKHSTGGVGDKTTLIIAPVVAACGVKVAKMSGRGLGFTGGTVDKLESIPGFNSEMTMQDFFDTVNRTGISVIGQSANLTPADKKLYALRDVTATVDSIPLIAASIMGKKLAAGNDAILLDVTTGSGAFMKETEKAIELALKMNAIGEAAGKKMVSLITDMDVPLGYSIGNTIEILEALDVLEGRGPEDLIAVCTALASNMLYLAGLGTPAECSFLVKKAISSGAAKNKFREMVAGQGGDVRYLDDPSLFQQDTPYQEVTAYADGYIVKMNAEGCGIASSLLGAGRITKESVIDPDAGILLKKKTGDAVQKGDVIATLYSSDPKLFENAKNRFLDSITIGAKKPQERPLILARIEKGQIQYF